LSPGSHIGYHETAANGGYSSENDKENRAVKNKGKDSLENDKENRAVKNKGKVAKTGRQNNNNKMTHCDSWLDHKQVICAQGCTSAAALDLDSNRGKKGEMGCNLLSLIDLSPPMKL
jgi:hypothetical protein